MRKLFLPIIAVVVFASCSEKPNNKPEEKGDVVKKDSVVDNPKVELINLSDNKSALKFANTYIEVDAKKGGRISSYKLNDQEVLSLQDVNEDMWGSTFWSSPQSVWNWPPPKAFDTYEYSLMAAENYLKLEGQMDSITKFTFVKEIKFDLEDTSVVITYSIRNDNEEIKKASHWEITRVAPNGLTFYEGKMENCTAPFTIVDTLNRIWFDYKNSKIQEGHDKLRGRPTSGYIAHANNGVLFLKQFEVDPNFVFAEKENQIEIYCNPDKSYIEIEPQGPYVDIEPGEEISWSVIWKLRKLPSEAKAQVGNKELIKFVDSQL